MSGEGLISDPRPVHGSAGHVRLNELMHRGTDFLGCEVAILGGAMSWVSERHLVSAISNAGGFGVIACGAMGPDLLAAEIAGTQALTVTVRALALRELNASNAFRLVRRELRVALINGAVLASIMALAASLWFSDWQLGGVVAMAIVLNLLLNSDAANKRVKGEGDHSSYDAVRSAAADTEVR